MGKIWLRSTDPDKQCCGCESKTGPCDRCFTCSGIFYDITSGVWYGPYNPNYYLSGVIASNCYVAQSSNDTNSIGTSTLTDTINPNTSYQANQFTLTTFKNSTGHFTLTTNTTTNNHPASYDVVSVEGPIEYAIHFDINSGHALQIVGPNIVTGDFAVMVTVLGEHLNGTPNGAGGYDRIFPFTSRYGDSYNGGSGITPMMMGQYDLSFYDLFTPYPIGGFVPIRTNTNVAGTGQLFPDISYTTEEFTYTLGDRCWVCVFHPDGSQWQYYGDPTHAGDLTPVMGGVYSDMVSAYLSNETSLINGNRNLGFTANLVADTASDQAGYEYGPGGLGKCCGAEFQGCIPSTLGESHCYPGTIKIRLYHSTAWPHRSFAATISNYLDIASPDENVCADIKTYYGGGEHTVVYSSTAGDLYRDVSKTIELVYTQYKQKLMVGKLGFTNNGIGTNCPFTLP